MKVLVTGATGFVGKHLVGALAARDHSVVALTRDTDRAVQLLGKSATCYAWHPHTGTLPKAALSDIDAIVHLAGESVAGGRWSQDRKNRIYQSRVEGSKLLVSAISEVPIKPQVFLSASAVGFYGDRGDEELTEKSSGGTGFLAGVCRDWERVLEDLPSTVRSVSLRIGVVLGKGGGALEKMLLPFKLGLGGPLGSGKQWMSWVQLDDLVSLILFCLEELRAVGPINAVAPHPVRGKDFAKAFGRVLGRPSFLPVPVFALKALMGEMSDLLLSSQRVLPGKCLKLGFRFKYAEIDSALSQIVQAL